MITVLNDKKQESKKSKKNIGKNLLFILIYLSYCAFTLPGIALKYLIVSIVWLVYKKNLATKTLLITSIFANKNLNKIFVMFSFVIYFLIFYHGTS